MTTERRYYPRPRRGVDHDQFFMYPVDESISAGFINSGKAIRSLDPKIRILANPLMRDSDEHLIAAAPYVDIWCPGILKPDHPQLPLLQGERKTLWSYSVGRRGSDSYAVHRLDLWSAFRMGVTGHGFWCYAVGEGWQNANMWDVQRETTFTYAVIYTLNGAPDDVSRAEKVIPSRRWEARREGIEDYTYLCMLWDLITRHRGDPGRTDAVDAGQQVLDAAVRTVLGHPEQTDQADRQRERVLDALGNLAGE